MNQSKDTQNVFKRKLISFLSLADKVTKAFSRITLGSQQWTRLRHAFDYEISILILFDLTVLFYQS